MKGHPINPQDIVKVICSLPLCSVQSGFESLQDGSVGHFRFPIGLRMIHRCEAIVNTELRAELPEPSIVELTAIIRYDNSRESEPTGYHFLDEALHLRFDDLGNRLCFDPLREVVNGDNKKSSLSCSWTKRPQYINSPLGKWPWRTDWHQWD